MSPKINLSDSGSESIKTYNLSEIVGTSNWAKTAVQAMPPIQFDNVGFSSFQKLSEQVGKSFEFNYPDGFNSVVLDAVSLNSSKLIENVRLISNGLSLSSTESFSVSAVGKLVAEIAKPSQMSEMMKSIGDSISSLERNPIHQILSQISEVTKLSAALGFVNFDKDYSWLKASQVYSPPNLHFERQSHIQNTPVSSFYQTQYDFSDTPIKRGKKASVETSGEIIILLAKVDIHLPNLWLGASDARKSGHHDYKRHCLISLRELFTHVLHMLAPDGEVRKWTNSPEYYDEEQKPTRPARLRYICRHITSRDMDLYIKKQIAAILEMVDLLHRAHELEISLTDKQLITLERQMEYAIRFMIETAFIDKKPF